MKKYPIVHITNQVSVEVIAHSTNKRRTRSAFTFALEYPRFIHAELMTHRVFTRNAASSRAVPVKTMVDLVRSRPAMPTHWGKNQPGMSAAEECEELVQIEDNVYVPREVAWQYGASKMARLALAFDAAGYHKQIVNRLTEPFQRFRVIVTTTEIDNFMWLRNHKDAQPEIQKVAKGIGSLLGLVDEGLELLYGMSEPEILAAGEWHTPFVDHVRDEHQNLRYYTNGVELTEEQALRVSSSCCAQASYRKLDDSVEKAEDIYSRLVESVPVHASPFEHQATPMVYEQANTPEQFVPRMWEDGITHVDRNGAFWSGNFKGFIQHRQLIPNHVCNHYVPH